MDEVNIWKARTGDYIAWIGDSRNNMESVNGILKIFNMREDTLIYGEPRVPEDIYLFGDPLNFNKEDYKEKRESCRIAFKLIQQQGIPREISEMWRIG